MRKVVIIPIVVVAVVIIGLSFIPMLEMYQLYSFDKANERYIGEGQKYVDSSYKRCLLSDVRADGACPLDSRGYNPNTGVYDMGTSGVAKLYADKYNLRDPYDQSSIQLSDEAFARMMNP